MRFASKGVTCLRRVYSPSVVHLNSEHQMPVSTDIVDVAPTTLDCQVVPIS